MSRNKVTAVCGAGAASAILAAGLLFTPAASATGNPHEGENSAYAIAAKGLVTIPKTPDVHGSGKASAVTVDVLPGNPFLSAKALNAKAGEGKASASVAQVDIDLAKLAAQAPKLPELPGQLADLTRKLHLPADAANPPKITLKVISAKCTDGGAASASLVSIKVGNDKHSIDLPTNAGTPVQIAKLLTLQVNKQVKNDDGSRTVTAVSLSLLPGTPLAQTVDLASATCSGEGNGGGTTEPSKPGNGGEKPGPNGEAPRPTPAKGHLDVTG